MCQRLIPAGERSGLLTRIAATESVYVVQADEKLTAFLELEIGDSRIDFDHPKRPGSATSIELTSLSNSE